MKMVTRAELREERLDDACKRTCTSNHDSDYIIDKCRSCGAFIAVESNFCPYCDAMMDESKEECEKPQDKDTEDEEDSPYTMLFRSSAKDYQRLKNFLKSTSIDYALYAEQDLVHHPTEKE